MGNKLLYDLIIIFISGLILDCIYFYIFNERLSKSIIHVQKSKVKINYGYALLFYIIFTFIIYFFIIRENKPIYYAFILGFCIYGVYDTTTKAIFNNWDSSLVIIDTLWGGILFSLVSMIVYYFNRYI